MYAWWLEISINVIFCGYSVGSTFIIQNISIVIIDMNIFPSNISILGARQTGIDSLHRSKRCILGNYHFPWWKKYWHQRVRNSIFEIFRVTTPWNKRIEIMIGSCLLKMHNDIIFFLCYCLKKRSCIDISYSPYV